MDWKRIERQKRWLNDEKGTIFKDWGSGVRVALAFPNRYPLGMSNLGLQCVYRAMNERDDVLCERVFYPEPDDLAALRRRPGDLPSVESQSPVRRFHLVAFCLPFENDYPNAVEMLALAGIPPLSRDRTDEHPLVAAVGVAAFLNPEPLADFIDFFFIGEAEAVLPDFWPVFHRLAGRGLERRDMLRGLATECPGIYVPSLYQPIYAEDGTPAGMRPEPGVPERVVYRRAEAGSFPVARSAVVTPHAEFSGATLVEIGRGCGHGCRFCAAGFVYRPARFHSSEKLSEAAGDCLELGPRLGLVSAAVSDHPELAELCTKLRERGASLSFSSVRADSVGPELLASLESSGRQALAIAPEAGSQRLRNVINKNLTEDQILSAADALAGAGILNIKLYFMIGLPTETCDDVDAIVRLAKRIKHHVLERSRGRRRLGDVTLSVNSFVPKPFTPFQWTPFAGVKELKERAGRIQNGLRKVANVRVHFDLPKWSYVQALLSRGDRRVADFLHKVAVERVSWNQAFRTSPHNPDFWVMRERRRDEIFPWNIVDHGVRREYLWKEYRRALRGETTEPCPVEGECNRCGVCRTGEERR
jgi:radical SAM family uncharacterized protein